MTAHRPGEETSSPRTPDAGSGAPAVGSGWQHTPAHYSPADYGPSKPQRAEPGGAPQGPATWTGPWNSAPPPDQHPQSPGSHGQNSYAYGFAYPSAAFGPPTTSTPPKRTRRTGLIVVAAVLVVALVGGGAALVAKNRTFFTQQDLVTRDDTVTLVVPTDWWDETSSKAGHSEGTGDDFSVTPDVEASSPDETMYVAVWVDRRPENSNALIDAQKEFVGYNCAKDACSSQSKTTSLTIDGHEALQQTIQLKADGS